MTMLKLIESREHVAIIDLPPHVFSRNPNPHHFTIEDRQRFDMMNNLVADGLLFRGLQIAFPGQCAVNMRR